MTKHHVKSICGHILLHFAAERTMVPAAAYLLIYQEVVTAAPNKGIVKWT